MRLESLHKKYQREFISSTRSERFIIDRLLHYLYPYRWIVALAILLLIVAKAIEAIVPVYVGYLAQRMIGGSVANFESRELLLHTLFYTGFTLIGLLFVGYIADSISIVLKNWVGQKIVMQGRRAVYHHILRLPVSTYDHETVGRLMTRSIHDVEQVNQLFAESLIPLLGSIVLFIGICIGIIVVDWRIALLFFALLPLVWWLTHRFRLNERSCYSLVRNIVSAMNTFLQEHLMGASTIRNFGLQTQEKEQFDELNNDHCEANLEAFHHFAFFISAIDFLQNFSLILVFTLLVSLAVPGSHFQIGTYFTFSLYALMFFRPLADLAERVNTLESAIASAERIFYTLDQSEEEDIQKMPAILDEVREIRFEDVWFAYEGENWILRGVSFTIKHGESVAIVGVSGVGKTTIMNLLLRFYEFQKGSITVNGHDIHDYSLHQLRSYFGLVPQDPVIFSGTIFDNIAFYDPSITSGHVQAVVDYVNLTSVVESFPQGLQHQISARGESLSTGQMQLLSLGRAVVHNRSVLILDEATANIDTVTEQIIQTTLAKVLKDKTALIIAHRLSTIRDATRILVLHHGIIAESGSHHELMLKKGLYEKLYRIQFLAP